MAIAIVIPTGASIETRERGKLLGDVLAMFSGKFSGETPKLEEGRKRGAPPA